MTKHTAKIFIVLIIIIACSMTGSGIAHGAVFTKNLDAAPFIENDRAFDTTRPIAEAFGIHVDWRQEDARVTLTRGATQVIMRVGSYDMTVINPESTVTYTMDVAPILKDGRVFLPARFWAERFGLGVEWLADTGGVAISEGKKVLSVTPGSSVISLSGGHFLKEYKEDPSLHFFYPESGGSGACWSGHAEVIVSIEGEMYTITAVNAGADRFDPIQYTDAQIESVIKRNASENNTEVKELPFRLYGRPAFMVSGTISGVPQAGVVFLNNGFICGISVEYSSILPVFTGATSVEIKAEDKDGGIGSADTKTGSEAGALTLDESEMAREARSVNAVIAESARGKYTEIINDLLREIMASFSIRQD